MSDDKHKGFVGWEPAYGNEKTARDLAHERLYTIIDLKAERDALAAPGEPR